MKNRSIQREDAARIAEKVRDFYDQHPYPPPVEDLDRYWRRWDNRQRRRADIHLFWPDELFREDRSVLVAGCGTSQAAKYALRWPKAQITGVDVSETSIKETGKLKLKYRLDNLDLQRLPIERVQEIGKSFDQVVCTGVLHHLPDPDAGLQSLREVLEPHGALHLMVYAPYGRAGIYLLQEYCLGLGIGSSADEIRDLATTLQALPGDHPIVPLLRNSPDFRSEAGIADALLHPQDRAYSVPELFDYVARSGLQFGRWLRQAPYLPHCGALTATPHQPLLADLPAREQYAALELFRGTMLRHNAVLYRDDHPGKPQPIRFDGDAWLEYVPLKLPETVCVEERLPPGAAGVLINRAHTYNDIYLPIDAREKKMFDAIDGQRTIGEITGSDERRETVRGFFQRLWWHDQVVFDASRCAKL